MAGNVKELQEVCEKFLTVNITFKPYKIPNNHLAFGMNIDFTEDGKIKQRDGTVKIKDLNTSNAYLDVFKEVRDGELKEHLILIDGSNFYVYNDTSNQFDLVFDSLIASDKWGGFSYISNFIFSNFQKVYRYYYNTTNNTYTIEDITNLTNGTGTVPPPKALLYEEFASRVFAAGDGTENVYWTEIGNCLSWKANDFIAFGSKITAIKAVGDFLFVGTEKGLFKISQTGNADIPFKVDTIINEGVYWAGLVDIKSSGVAALLKSGRVLVFDSYYSQGSQTDDTIGLPIQDFLKNITSDFASVKKVGRRYYITHTSDKNITSGLNVKTLVFNLDTVGFSFYSIPVEYPCQYKFKTYFINTANKKVLQFDSLTFQDDGQDFETYILTKVFTGETPEYKKNFRWLFLTSDTLKQTKLKIEYAINFSQNFYLLDSYTYLSSTSLLGFSFLGDIILGGSLLQKNRIRLGFNTNGVMLKISRGMSNSDFQINSMKITYYPSYRQ